MELSKLISCLGASVSDKRNIEKLTYDSREAGPSSLFFCLRGSNTDGHKYIPDAYARGCRAFLVEEIPEGYPEATFVKVDNTTEMMAVVAEFYYGNPAQKLHIIGVTGTSGKTTTCLLTEQIFLGCGKHTGSLGTNGAFIDGKLIEELHNTTPDSLIIARLLAAFVEAGVEYVVIEVSSQAYKLQRVFGITFDVGIFTNINALDHISPVEHPTFEDYRECKSMLMANARESVIFANDPETEFMISRAAGKVHLVDIDDPRSDIHATDIYEKWERNNCGIDFNILFEHNSYPVSLSVPGLYNVTDALMAARAALCEGLCLSDISAALSKAVVPGRFELIHDVPYATIIIDYAHNYSSLSSILKSLSDNRRKLGGGKIYSLFGAAGGKAYTRRPGLGKAAQEYSDFVIVTDDDPNYEDTSKIHKEIISGFSPDFTSYIAIPNRETAIIYALDHLRENDILLLAGKGHEEFIKIQGEYVPFNEKEIVRTWAKNNLKDGKRI